MMRGDVVCEFCRNLCGKPTPENYKQTILKSGHNLRLIPIEMHTDELYKLSIADDGNNIQYIPKNKRTKKLCILAIKNKCSKLEYIPEEFIDENLIISFVKNQMGESSKLKYVPGAYKTPAVCREAVKRNKWNLEYVPIEMRTKEICQFALNDGRYKEYIYEFVPTEIKIQMNHDNNNNRCCIS